MDIRGGSLRGSRWLDMRFVAQPAILLSTAFLLGAAFLLAPAAAQSAKRDQSAKWPDVALNGRIVTGTFAGVPAAEVWVTDADGHQVARTFADGDGYYQLRKLPIGRLRVHAKGEQLVSASMPVETGSFSLTATLMLQEAAPLQGIATMADGTPAQGVDIVVYDLINLPDPFRWQGEATTDANGAWRIESAPLRSMKARAFLPGHALVDFDIDRAQQKQVKVVIPKQRIGTRQVKVDGIPEGVSVTVLCRTSKPNGRAAQPLPRSASRLQVAADGTVTAWMLGMHYETRIHAEGYRSMPLAIPCAPGKRPEMEFRLQPLPKAVTQPSTEVRGKLVDALGTPIAGVAVVAIQDDRRADPAVTDTEGRFVLDVPATENVLYKIGLLSPRWRLGDTRCKVGTDGITWQTLPAKAGKAVVLHATSAGNLRGTLRGPGGTPFAAARVELTRADKKLSMRVLGATDAAGRIDFSGIPLGPYSLKATSAAGHVGTCSIKVFGDQVASPGNLEFASGAELRGQVTDAAGKPLAAAPIRILPGNPRMPARLVQQMGFFGTSGRFAVTDRNGNYRLPIVVDGDWVAILVAADARNQPFQQFSMEGSRVEVDLMQN